MCIMESSLLVLLLSLASLANAATWDYDATGNKGPSHWEPSAVCKAKRQSPINIVMEDTEYDEDLPNLQFTDYDNVHANTTYTLKNNGHTAVVNMAHNGNQGTTRSKVAFQGDTYAAFQFHFHWGKDDTTGSEHTVDGMSYAAELHIVHYNTKYDFGSAEFLSKGDGLLVVGTFIKKGAAHPSMNKLTDHFGRVTYSDTDYSIPTFPLDELLSNDVSTHYMHYKGSLTTPPCSEAVMWIVSNSPVTMDETQFAQFRALHAHQASSMDPAKYISGNYRPVMALHGREVSRSFEDVISSASTLKMSTLLLPTLLALIYV